MEERVAEFEEKSTFKVVMHELIFSLLNCFSITCKADNWQEKKNWTNNMKPSNILFALSSA